jgi:hypothetical protein
MLSDDGSEAEEPLYDLPSDVFWKLAPYARHVEGDADVTPSLTFHYNDDGYDMFKAHCLAQTLITTCISWNAMLDTQQDEKSYQADCLAVFGNAEISQVREPVSSPRLFAAFEKAPAGMELALECDHAVVLLNKPA